MLKDSFGEEAANEAIVGWDGYAEVVAGLGVVAAGTAMARKSHDFIQNRPPKSQPSLMAPGSNKMPMTNKTVSILMESSLNGSSIIPQSADLHKGNMQSLGALLDKGAGGHYREQVGLDLAKKGISKILIQRIQEISQEPRLTGLNLNVCNHNIHV